MRGHVRLTFAWLKRGAITFNSRLAWESICIFSAQALSFTRREKPRRVNLHVETWAEKTGCSRRLTHARRAVTLAFSKSGFSHYFPEHLAGKRVYENDTSFSDCFRINYSVVFTLFGPRSVNDGEIWGVKCENLTLKQLSRTFCPL